MRHGLVFFFVACAAAGQAPERLERILDRVSEEAAAFSNFAPRIIGRETLRQKAVKPRRRFRIRIGKDAAKPPPLRYQTREIVSEYGFTTFREAPGSLHELRTVVSVDGRQVVKGGKARETLTLGISKPDDKVKKRLLREFQKHGLSSAATDFGQLVMLFERRQLGDYRFELAREGFLGAERAVVIRYQQLQGPDSVTIFEGRRAIKARLEGELWVRASDYVPLRITTVTTIAENKHTIQHRGAVDYFSGRYGAVLPASVRYKKLVDGQPVVENVATYSGYQMFTVDAEIQFAPAGP
ncbi:MAG: hypothetical protein GY953_07845 [bacterium]|nr:hypothetical protein [bacterium]